MFVETCDPVVCGEESSAQATGNRLTVGLGVTASLLVLAVAGLVALSILSVGLLQHSRSKL